MIFLRSFRSCFFSCFLPDSNDKEKEEEEEALVELVCAQVTPGARKKKYQMRATGECFGYVVSTGVDVACKRPLYVTCL